MAKYDSGVNTIPKLSVKTMPYAHDSKLSKYLDEEAALFFENKSLGLVGQGAVLEQSFAGESRFSDASTWWMQVVENAEVLDTVRSPGTGLTGFARFAFSDQSPRQSSIVIPQLIVGRDSRGTWLTTIDTPHALPTMFDRERQDRIHVDWSETSPKSQPFEEVVRKTIGLIRESVLEKVVLGRQISAKSNQAMSIASLVDYLSETQPETYRFAFDGLVGASPEMISQVRGNELFIEVLAGSAPRTGAAHSVKSQEEKLLTGKKDLSEHRLAVKSVLDVLQDIPNLEVSVGELSTLGLRDVLHLSTSIKCTSSNPLDGLAILEKLHPTASVAGTPRGDALRTIRDLEEADRGFFSGPVGWLDAEGNQEFVLALRSAELSDDRRIITAFAGAGIVKGSDPRKEFDETSVKFKTIQDYFV